MSPQRQDAVFKALTWIASTLLSAGIAWGSVQARVTNLEKRQDAMEQAFQRMYQQGQDLGEIKGLLREHLRQDSKGR